MVPARLLFPFEFTAVHSCGAVFVYMISAQNLIPERVHPGYCTTGARLSFRYENSFRCRVNAVRLIALALNHSPGSMEQVARAQSSVSKPVIMTSQSRRST